MLPNEDSPTTESFRDFTHCIARSESTRQRIVSDADQRPCRIVRAWTAARKTEFTIERDTRRAARGNTASLENQRTTSEADATSRPSGVGSASHRDSRAGGATELIGIGDDHVSTLDGDISRQPRVSATENQGSVTRFGEPRDPRKRGRNRGTVCSQTIVVYSEQG